MLQLSIPIAWNDACLRDGLQGGMLQPELERQFLSRPGATPLAQQWPPPPELVVLNRAAAPPGASATAQQGGRSPAYDLVLLHPDDAVAALAKHHAAPLLYLGSPVQLELKALTAAASAAPHAVPDWNAAYIRQTVSCRALWSDPYNDTARGWVAGADGWVARTADRGSCPRCVSAKCCVSAKHQE
jgi:hypothetical protein